MWNNTVWNEFNGTTNRHGARQVSRITKMIPQKNKNFKPSYIPMREKSKLPFEYETPNRSGAQNNPVNNYDGMEIYKKKFFDFLEVQPLSTDWQTMQLNYEMPDYDDPVYKSNVEQAKRDGIKEDVIKVRFKPPLKMVRSSLVQSMGNLNQLIPFIVKAREVDAIRTQLDQDIILRALADSRGESKTSADKLYTMLLNQTGKINTNIYSLTELIDIAKQGVQAPRPAVDEGVEVQPDQGDDKVNQLNPTGQVLIRPVDVGANTPTPIPDRPDNYFIDPYDVKEPLDEKVNDIDKLIKTELKSILEKKKYDTFDKIYIELQRSILMTITDVQLIKRFETKFKEIDEMKNKNVYEKTKFQNFAYKLMVDLLDKNPNNAIISTLGRNVDQVKNKFKQNIQPIILQSMNETQVPTKPTRGRPKGSKDSKKREPRKPSKKQDTVTVPEEPPEKKADEEPPETKGNGYKGKGMKKNKKVKNKVVKQNKWIDHVKMYCDKHKCSWAEGLKGAKDSY
jgi:hypothetical protein